MFYCSVISAGKVIMYSAAFDCLLAGLCKSYSTDFHKLVEIWHMGHGRYIQILDVVIQITLRQG